MLLCRAGVWRQKLFPRASFLPLRWVGDKCWAGILSYISRCSKHGWQRWAKVYKGDETPKRQNITSETYSQTEDVQQLRGRIFCSSISLMVKLLMYNALSVYNSGLDIFHRTHSIPQVKHIPPADIHPRTLFLQCASAEFIWEHTLF